MPPAATITRAHIEDAAFEIARTEGIDAVSARRIATALKCSTQPVYTACESMDAVKQAVLHRAQRMAEQYLSTPEPGSPPFLQLGMGTLRFANQEPHLFRIANDAIREHLDKPPPPVLDAMHADPALAGLSREQLIRIHTLMWVFSQGLAVLVPKGSPERAMTQAREHLRTAGEAIIEHELRSARR